MKFPVAITRFASRQALKIDKNSPQILFAAGITGVVGSAVLACKATLRLEEHLDEHADKSSQIDETEAKNLPSYPPKDAQHDRMVLTIQTGTKLVRLYGPALVLGGVSIACLAQSHRIMSQRNAAITAAYIAVDRAFKDYRQRVINDFGKEKDDEYRHGKQYVEVSETDGNGKQKTRTVVKADTTNGVSMYAKVFDEMSPRWKGISEHDFTFLQCIQAQATQRLRAKGHLFLNEVYDDLGIPRTKEGQIVGWVDGYGDGYVDMGFMDMTELRVRDFINGIDNTILLDFNVDGPIMELI